MVALSSMNLPPPSTDSFAFGRVISSRRRPAVGPRRETVPSFRLPCTRSDHVGHSRNDDGSGSVGDGGRRCLAGRVRYVKSQKPDDCNVRDGGGRTVPGSSASGSSAAAMTGIGVTGGGSTILEPAVSDAPKAALQRWFPGEALELKFRATRDGWSPEAFHSKCDDSRRTVSLFRVYDSVIGGFSDVPWFSEYGGYAKSSGAFLFMLKDDTGNDFQPERWGTRNGHEPDAVYTDADCGPTFGSSQDDLSAKLSPSYGYAEDDGYLQTGNTSYDIPAGSAFLDLGDQPVSEIEVFQLYPAPSASNACAPVSNNPDAPAVVPIMHGDDDVYN